MGQLAPDWWMRGVTRSGVRNAPFREASRREVEPEMGQSEGRSPARKGGHALGSLSLVLKPSLPFSSWFMFAPASPVLRSGSSLLAWFLRSWPCERPVVGGADGRRSRAGCVVHLRVRTRGAGEGSPAAWDAGTRRDHADGRGRGTRWPLKGGLFLLFLYACCGAVSL